MKKLLLLAAVLVSGCSDGDDDVIDRANDACNKGVVTIGDRLSWRVISSPQECEWFEYQLSIPQSMAIAFVGDWLPACDIGGVGNRVLIELYLPDEILKVRLTGSGRRGWIPVDAGLYQLKVKWFESYNCFPEDLDVEVHRVVLAGE